MISKTLSYSLINHKIIDIIYMKDTEITQRKIQVLKLDQDNITALDMEKKAIRIFKIEHILSAIYNDRSDQKLDTPLL